jgi:hypothetical protein
VVGSSGRRYQPRNECEVEGCCVIVIMVERRERKEMYHIPYFTCKVRCDIRVSECMARRTAGLFLEAGVMCMACHPISTGGHDVR